MASALKWSVIFKLLRKSTFSFPFLHSSVLEMQFIWKKSLTLVQNLPLFQAHKLYLLTLKNFYYSHFPHQCKFQYVFLLSTVMIAGILTGIRMPPCCQRLLVPMLLTTNLAGYAHLQVEDYSLLLRTIS